MKFPTQSSPAISQKSRLRPAAWIPLIAAIGLGNASAATYNWLAVRATGTGTGWTARPNYEGGLTGQFSPTLDDVLVYDAGSRNITVNNANGTNATDRVGRIVIGPGLSGNISQEDGYAINLASGGTYSGAYAGTFSGIEILAGKTTNTNINARLNLIGNITIANNGGSRLRLGNPGEAGGIAGTADATLNIIKGAVLLPQVAAGHTFAGAVFVDNGGSGGGGTLQLDAGSTFSSYSSLTVGTNGTLSGGGTFGGATITSGRISPGGLGSIDAGPTTLSFTNLLTLQSGGNIAIDVKQAGADRIAGTTITLGGENRIRLNSDYSSEGTYQLLSGILSGNFDSVTIRTDTDDASVVNLVDNGGGVWTGDFTARGYGVTFDANTGFLTLAAIPEPASGFLSLAGAALLILKRRRP